MNYIKLNDEVGGTGIKNLGGIKLEKRKNHENNSKNSESIYYGYSAVIDTRNQNHGHRNPLD